MPSARGVMSEAMECSAGYISDMAAPLEPQTGELPAEVFVVGGTAMLLAYNRTKLTRDVDAVTEDEAVVEREARVSWSRCSKVRVGVVVPEGAGAMARRAAARSCRVFGQIPPLPSAAWAEAAIYGGLCPQR